MARQLSLAVLIISASTGLSACTSTSSVGDLFSSENTRPAASESEKRSEVKKPKEDKKEVAAVRRGSPPSPNSLLNQDKEHVLSALGQPTLLREELDSQMWQYSGQSCAFFLYLYPDSGGTFRVTHLEARAHQGGSLDPKVCLESQWGKKVRS